MIADEPLTNSRWEVVLPPGLARLSGALSGAALERGASGNNFSLGEALVLVERPGLFHIGLSVLASRDSSTWSRLEYNHVIRVSPDSFETVKQIDWSTLRDQVVMDGVHYGICELEAVPLDPGEDEQDVPIHPFYGLDKGPPVVEQHAAKRPRIASAVGTIEVPIRVAVDRTGRVKAVSVSDAWGRAPTPDEQAALEAARKWRFTPTIQKGRPVTALYLIRVPVLPADAR